MQVLPISGWFWRAEAGAKGALTDIWSHTGTLVRIPNFAKFRVLYSMVFAQWEPCSKALEKILNERASPLPLSGSKSFDLCSVSEKKSAEKCVTDARQALDEFRINRMPIALNLAILRQKMLLSAANSFSSANATIKTKQDILWQILQFTVVIQSKPPVTVRETFTCITTA